MVFVGETLNSKGLEGDEEPWGVTVVGNREVSVERVNISDRIPDVGKAENSDVLSSVVLAVVKL